MAKGQHLSNHQRGIVNRYYENRDTIALTRLGEIVSDLALCESPRKSESLWKSAETFLKNAGADGARASKVLASRDVKALAELVGELGRK